MKDMDVTLLWPGRHHLLTKFQHDYLKKLATEGLPDGRKVKKIIVAVTSANHESTRRNPLRLYLRSLALEDFLSDFPCESRIYPIKDIPYTDKYGAYLIGQLFYQSGEKLTPEDTVLACSTPSVIEIFKKLGFGNVPMELTDAAPEKYSALRPFEVTELLVKAEKDWRNDGAEWQALTSPATVKLYKQYNLGDLIIEVFNDALLTDDADITETRDYHSYAQGMDVMVDVKFSDIKPFVVDGKIVDVGCSTGSLIQLLAKAFPESDIIGIEAVRRFYEYCKMQEYAGICQSVHVFLPKERHGAKLQRKHHQYVHLFLGPARSVLIYRRAGPPRGFEEDPRPARRRRSHHHSRRCRAARSAKSCSHEARR